MEQATWIIAIATSLSVIVAGVSVYLFNKSLRLLIIQNATSDIEIYKERYEDLENSLRSVNFSSMRNDMDFRNFFETHHKRYNTNVESSLIDHKLTQMFHNKNGLDYYSLYKFILQYLKGNDVYKQVIKNPAEKPDNFNDIISVLFLVHHWFISEIIIRNKREIEQYLTDLLKSHISNEQKKHYFNKIKNKLLRDYYLMITRKENDLYIYDGTIKSLFNDTPYLELSRFIKKIEPQFSN